LSTHSHVTAQLSIRADRSVCKGARSCARRAPATFSLDAQRRVVIAPQPGDADDEIVAAARACPNFVLEVSRGEERIV